MTGATAQETTQDKHLLYQFDSFLVDATAFRLTRDGLALALEPKALQLLLFLLENQGRLLKKQELLESVWGDLSVTENALTREIALLRRVLGDSTKDPKYIETVPTQGYRFIAEVVEVRKDDEPVLPPSPSAEEPDEKKAGFASLRARTLVVAAGLLMLVAVGVLLWIWKYGVQVHTRHAVRDFQLVQATSADSLDAFPYFSLDGKSIVYSSEKSGSFEIYLRQLQSNGGEIQLTSDDGGNIEPAWSADGQWIAYHSMKYGGIWMIPALGGTPRRLTDFGSRPAWSHDGSRIAFQSGEIGAFIETELGATPESTIWMVSLADGTLKELTHSSLSLDSSYLRTPWSRFGDSSPQWSPDDQQVLFAASGKIWIVSAGGGTPQPVISDKIAYDPVYSRDGKKIYFLTLDISGSEIWEVAVSQSGAATGEAEKIYSAAPGVVHYLAVSGSDNQLAFSLVSTQDNLYSIKVPAGAEDAPLPLTWDTRLRKAIPVFSPDGSHVAFSVAQSGRHYQIWIATSDGKISRQIPVSEGSIVNPCWYNNDVFCYWTSDDKEIRLWRWNLKTGRPVNVFRSEEKMSSMRVSPDGKMVAFMRTDQGAINVWKLSLDSNQATQLTFDKKLAGWPCWSHSGKFVAFETKVGATTQIAVVPSSGGNPTLLTHDSGQDWPRSWSPDDEEIAFAGLRDGVWNIFSVSRKTGVERQLTHYTHPDSFVRYPDWSPTGKQIAYEYGVSTANIWLLQPR